VPEFKRGFFPSHLDVIKQRMKGFHVQINARSEKDISPEIIRTKLKDISYGGANLSSVSSNAPVLPPLKTNRAEVKDQYASARAPASPPIPPASSTAKMHSQKMAPQETHAELEQSAVNETSAGLIDVLGKHGQDAIVTEQRTTVLKKRPDAAPSSASRTNIRTYRASSIEICFLFLTI
jgi:hypothetical protein